MVNSGQINKCQDDNFMKWLKLVLVYRIVYENTPKAARNKDFRTYVNLKSIALKP